MDDIYEDPTDPQVPTQILEDAIRYDKVIEPMPNKGKCSTFLIGTPISDRDMFKTLPKRKGWKHIHFNVFSTQNLVVTMKHWHPHIMNKQQALDKKKEAFISFQSEYMCIPYFDSNNIISRDDMSKLIREGSQNYDISQPYRKQQGEIVVIGADIGRVEDPTHIAVFSKKGNVVTQLYSRFLQEVPFPDQVRLLNKLAEVFQVDRAAVDNTNNSLTDRNLDPVYDLVNFTTALKKSLLSAFLFYVRNALGYLNKTAEDSLDGILGSEDYILEFLDDELQLSHITSVDKQLRSPRNKEGHGDAFFSVSLALREMKSEESTDYVTFLSDPPRGKADVTDIGTRLQRLGINSDDNTFSVF